MTRAVHQKVAEAIGVTILVVLSCFLSFYLFHAMSGHIEISMCAGCFFPIIWCGIGESKIMTALDLQGYEIDKRRVNKFLLMQWSLLWPLTIHLLPRYGRSYVDFS